MPDETIEAVVFDFGAVLLEWNPRHLYTKIFDDPARVDWFLTEVCPPPWNVEQDRGRTIAEAEDEAIARHPDQREAIRAFYARFQEMIPHSIAGTVSALRALKEAGYPVYGLTNFSAETFPPTRARFDFFDLFDGIVVSGEERVIKPDPEIYRRLIERFSLDPKRTAFVDDSPANVEAAERFGIKSHRFEQADAMADWMRGLGLPV
jgi:2-haloacid dehalogenase